MAGVDQRRRLREDLAALGVPRPLAPEFFDEVFYAVFPRVHERRVALFGAMTLSPYADRFRRLSVVQPPLPFPLPELVSRVWADQPVAVARQLADGQSTFLVASGADRVELLNVDGKANELALARLMQVDGYASVQRTGDGKVRLFLPEFLATHTRNVWTAKPYSSEMYWPLGRLKAPDVGQRILDLAVHVLSASNVGATIFWSQRDDWTTSPALDRTKAVRVRPQALADVRVFAGIRNIAAQNDRAMVVDLQGVVTAIGVALKHPGVPDSEETEGGMRHNSAMKASIEDPEAVVLVCSEDGPVSVFFQGRKIASFVEARWREACDFCGGSGQIQSIVQEARGGPVRVELEACVDCGGHGSIWTEESMLPPPIAPGLKRAPKRRKPSMSKGSGSTGTVVGGPRAAPGDVDPRQGRLPGL